MRLYYQHKGRLKHTMCFATPESADSSGGGQAEDKTPFDDIALDELDPATRASIEKGKADFIATRSQTRELTARLGKQEDLTRRFQSAHDRDKAELDRIFGRNVNPNAAPQVSEVVSTALASAGYKPEDIQKLGPMFSTMLEKVGEIQSQKIGEGMRPLATKVIEQEALGAFQTAQQTAPMGIMQIPEVAEKVWQYVVERTKAGQQTTPEIAVNLGKMAYIDHCAAERAAGREVQIATLQTDLQQTTQPNPPAVNQFTFPGASNIRPAVRQTVASNGGGSALNADTEAALQTTFKSMTSGMTNKDGAQLAPKAFAKGGK